MINTRFSFTIVGALIGVVSAYALRPSKWGIRPSFEDIITYPEFWAEFALYAGAGAVIGLFLGIAISSLMKGNDE